MAMEIDPQLNHNEKKSLVLTTLSRVENLPSLPTVVQDLNLALQQDCDMQAIAELVRQDPGITLQVLHLINTPHYGLAQEVSSVDHALTLLGKKEIQNIHNRYPHHHLYHQLM